MAQGKSQFEAAVRERFLGSPLFPAVRTGYQLLFNRSKYLRRRRMARFYSQFIASGDLVFDIGANVGVYAEILSGLGARVVAVEPNPECVRLLKSLERRASLVVVPCAAGDAPGKLVLRLSDNSQLSSANPEWQKQVDSSKLHQGSHWRAEISVDTVTLDQLHGRFGLPAFVKIDVEGLDDKVLRGMSFRPGVVTFEYNRLLPSVAMRCLESPVLDRVYEFNFVDTGELRCVSTRWLGRSEFLANLNSLAGEEPSGDVIARLRG